jgi:Uncharacterised protein family (UPF0236)
MVTASVLDLEEPAADWGRAPTRRELHENFDAWLDTLEEAVTEKSLSLDALARKVLAQRQERTSMVTEALVQRRHRQALDQKTAPCPQCARLLPARALVPRTVETLVGEVSFERPYFYCLGCKRGFYPLDEDLELSERRKQWDIQEAGAKLAAEVPFETAQELFSELTGLSLSGHTTHEVVEELGQGLGVLEVSPTAKEIAQRVSNLTEGKKQPSIMLLALDGAGRMYPPARREPEGLVRDGRGTDPAGLGGRGNGRRLRGSGSTWWIRSGLFTC